MIFVEKDMFMIICLLVIIVLIAIIIIGMRSHKKKSLTQAPTYVVTGFSGGPLAQNILQTGPTFQMELTVQDALLKQQYAVGKEVQMPDGTMAKVSRLRKRIVQNGAIAGYLYTIYFEPYEYIEFPRTIHMQKCEQVDTIELTRGGATFSKNNSVVLKRNWGKCFFTTMNQKIRICQTLNSVTASDLIFEKDFFSPESDFYFLEEILDKYAVLSN